VSGVVVSDCVEDGAVVDMKDTGLADTVGQSEAALPGLPLREEVSDMCGEYFRWSGDLAGGSIGRTRLALEAGTTLAVLRTGDPLARTGVAGTSPPSSPLLPGRETAVDG